ADEVGIFIGLEIRQTHDYRLRRECTGDLRNALAQLVDIEIDGAVVPRDLLGDRVLEFGALLVEFEQCPRMHADHAIDDELEARESDAAMRNAGEIERPVRVADVHGDLDGNRGHGVHLDAALIELEHAFIDVAGVAFRAGHRDRLVFLDIGGRGAAAHDRRDAELARDDGGVAGASAAIGHDGRGALHDRLPVRILHVGHQNIAAPHPRHLLGVFDDAGVACADALPDAAAASEHLRAGLQGIALDGAAGAALYPLGPGLQDVNLPGAAVLAPFDVHWRAVVIFDDQRLLRQLGDVRLGERETMPVGMRDINGAHALLGAGVGIDHFDGLSADVLAHDGAAASAQSRLVHINLVRVDGALHDG